MGNAPPLVPVVEAEVELELEVVLELEVELELDVEPESVVVFELELAPLELVDVVDVLVLVRPLEPLVVPVPVVDVDVAVAVEVEVEVDVDELLEEVLELVEDELEAVELVELFVLEAVAELMEPDDAADVLPVLELETGPLSQVPATQLKPEAQSALVRHANESPLVSRSVEHPSANAIHSRNRTAVRESTATNSRGSRFICRQFYTWWSFVVLASDRLAQCERGRCHQRTS